MYKLFCDFFKSLLGTPAQYNVLLKKETAIEIGSTAESLEVMPELTEASWKILAEEFPEKMKPYMEGFSKEAVYSLCKYAEKNAIAGYRADRLADIIQEQYKVSATKAESLAYQATSLYMAIFHKLGNKEAGITRYIWRTSKDQRVCKNCARLEGKTFFYLRPPIVDRTTGRHANPGEHYCCQPNGCRCVDEPVL